MEKLKSFLLSLILLVPFITLSQEECGTDEIIRRNPFLQQLYAERVACAPEVDLDTAQVLTIPVVFHILHLGEAIGEETNISDEQILSCIENLNHRFRGDVEALSALTDEYDEYELSLVKDAKIEFCLAARDPDNNPTDGINRYDCSDLTYDGESYALDGISNGSGFDSGVSDSYIKNLFHWPVDKYFNCYVVSEINGNDGGNGIQGYSYLGSSGLGTNGYIYGPVCLYNVTGITGTLKWSRELNSTWTHEIGHALDLFHTFSNAGSDPCSETNGCTQGDQVPDTPPTNANNVGCVTGDCPDAMLENYMDYTPEWCKTAFTQGQIERMRDEIYTGLPYLISADNVSCQSPNSKDVGITSVSVPSDWCLSTIDFNVKINNFGGESAENVTLLVNGVSYEVPTIEADGFVLIPFTNFALGSGIIECEVVYDLDEFLDNNTFTQVVEILEQNWLEVILSPDYWGNEIAWEITDENGNTVLFEDDYPLGAQDIDFHKSTCLPDGCYMFTITDSNGDGMCSFDFGNDGICDAYYDAFVNVIVNEGVILDISGAENIDYGSELTFEFCVIYCPPSTSCKGDFDGDGLVTVRDLMSLLSTPQGTLTECSDYDLNNDLQIDLNDILDFLSVMGTDCFTGEIFNVGMIPLDLQSKIRDLTDVNHVILDKQILSTKYYTLRGVEVTYTRSLSDGVYIKETIYSDGTRDVIKIFISEN
jgi:hypothetical protein